MTHILTIGEVDELKLVQHEFEMGQTIPAYNRLREFIQTLEEEKKMEDIHYDEVMEKVDDSKEDMKTTNNGENL